jgi:hypothetical protein
MENIMEEWKRNNIINKKNLYEILQANKNHDKYVKLLHDHTIIRFNSYKQMWKVLNDPVKIVGCYKHIEMCMNYYRWYITYHTVTPGELLDDLIAVNKRLRFETALFINCREDVEENRIRDKTKLERLQKFVYRFHPTVIKDSSMMEIDEFLSGWVKNKYFKLEDITTNYYRIIPEEDRKKNLSYEVWERAFNRNKEVLVEYVGYYPEIIDFPFLLESILI